MTTTRRAFLSSVAAAGTALPLAARAPAAPRSRKPMKLLVLGGTAFLGPHFVRAALANGHEVTLFNRGKTNPEMFQDLEQLRGDRDKHELGALKGRDWDAVLDTSGYVPGHVREAAELLKDHVGHYQFISTISVYGNFMQRPMLIDEDAGTATVSQEVVDEVQNNPHVGEPLLIEVRAQPRRAVFPFGLGLALRLLGERGRARLRTKARARLLDKPVEVRPKPHRDLQP